MKVRFNDVDGDLRKKKLLAVVKNDFVTAHLDNLLSIKNNIVEIIDYIHTNFEYGCTSLFFSYIYCLFMNKFDINLLESVGKANRGKLPDYYFQDSQIDEIILPDNITNLDDFCFSGCRELKKVILGNRVYRIGSEIFTRSIHINTLTLPASIKILNKDALFGIGSHIDKIKFLGTLEYAKTKLRISKLKVNNDTEFICSDGEEIIHPKESYLWY